MSVQSRASKLVLVLAAALAPACASPVEDVAFEADIQNDGVAPRQIPVDTSKVTGIQFMYDGLPFLQVLATGDAVERGSKFARRTEYWAATSAVPVSNLTSLEMVATEVRETDRAMTGFLYPDAHFGAALTAPQVVSPADWTKGEYAPGSMNAKLFKAPDPDDPSRSIGLLIEQNARGKLVATTWYKAANDTGRIFDHTPHALTFSAVVDDHGRPTSDPRYIDGYATWYHYTAR